MLRWALLSALPSINTVTMGITLYMDHMSQPSRCLLIFGRLNNIDVTVKQLRIAQNEHRKFLKGILGERARPRAFASPSSRAPTPVLGRQG